MDTIEESRFVYCRDCGEKIRQEAEICPECGIRQQKQSGTEIDTDNLTDQYSVGVWIASILVGLITLPAGLILPIYFFIKARNGTGVEQSGLEVGTVLLTGIFGIAAVELGGRKGAKVLWGLLAGLLVLVFLFAFAVAL